MRLAYVSLRAVLWSEVPLHVWQSSSAMHSFTVSPHLKTMGSTPYLLSMSCLTLQKARTASFKPPHFVRGGRLDTLLRPAAETLLCTGHAMLTSMRCDALLQAAVHCTAAGGWQTQPSAGPGPHFVGVFQVSQSAVVQPSFAHSFSVSKQL